MPVHYKMKICLVGDSGVGKTSLIRRYVHNEFDERYISTIGTRVSKKDLTFVLPKTNKEAVVTLLIWDIMGAKGIRELLKEAYFHEASGILAVCDLTRGTTLDGISEWIESVQSVAGSVPTMVLANKVDLKDVISIEKRSVAEFSKKYETQYLLTSAKTGENVEKSFRLLFTLIAKELATGKQSIEE